MEGPCDFAIHLSRDDEIANPCFKSRDVGVIAVAAHIAPDLVLADGKRHQPLAAPTLVFNVDLLRLPELVLPDALQRPCHQMVLGFHGIILTARPLRLIARSLAPERPLTLERAGFGLKLAESGNRESEAIGCQRFE